MDNSSMNTSNSESVRYSDLEAAFYDAIFALESKGNGYLDN